MQQTARGLNLNFAQTESLLTKHSKNLALFAGSAVRGRQEFEKIASESADTRRKFQKLGISSEEFSEMQASYLNQQMRSGKGQKKTTEEMTAGSIKYIKELDTLSKLTGASKKDLQSLREARMNDPKFRAGTVDMKEEIVNEVHSFLDYTAVKASKELAKGMQDYLGSGSLGGKGDQAEIISSFGQEASNVLRVLDQVRSGEIKHGEATDRIAILAQKTELANREYARVQGDQTVMGKNYVAIAQLAMGAGKNTQQLIDEENARKEKQIADEKSEGAKLAETKQALEQAGRDIEIMSTSSKLVTFLMNEFATGMELVTEKLYEMSGEDLPAHLKAKKEERKALAAVATALKALEEAQKRVADNTVILSPEEQGFAGDHGVSIELRNLEKKQEEAAAATKKREAAERAAGIGSLSSTSTSSTSSTSGSGEDTATRALTGAGSDLISDYSGLNINNGKKVNGQYESVAGGPASAKIIAIARKFQNKYPGGIFTAFNDTLPSHKGTSHGKGLAFDYALPGIASNAKIPVEKGKQIESELRAMGASMALDEYNNKSASATGGHIHAQISARTGGIFSGPDSGYLAELHGDESVSSVGDSGSVSKSALGSGSMMTNSSNKITEMFNNLFEKMDTLIELSDTSMENQKKFLEAKLS
jgi:hypothetical protein